MAPETQEKTEQKRHPDAWLLTAWQFRRRLEGSSGRRVQPTYLLYLRQRTHSALLWCAALVCVSLLAALLPPAAANAAPEPEVRLRCRPVVVNATKKIVEWSPHEDKYLLPLCQFGALNNQVPLPLSVPLGIGG